MDKTIKEFTPGTSRIEAFSDGVFAIVVTLLVLELRVPHLPENFTSQDVITELIHLTPKFVSFAMSFLVVAIFWVNHHQLFHSLDKTDRATLWYNNLLLFWLSFVPFPTAFIGEHPSSMIPVMLYGFAMFAAGFSFMLMLRHAIKANLFSPLHSKELIEQGVKKGRIGPVIYLISIVTALISVYISLAIFILVPVFYFVPQKIVKFDSQN
ncbi:MAG TPA: TMEM175 family protein [Ignavibacteria bacterium]|nr:TMEM175 family protein [Ignavibacteria bacterium]